MSIRTNRRSKSVYDRIENVKEEIRETEEKLAQLNLNLKNLNAEKDDLEMHKLFACMKEKGIDINDALNLFQQ